MCDNTRYGNRNVKRRRRNWRFIHEDFVNIYIIFYVRDIDITSVNTFRNSIPANLGLRQRDSGRCRWNIYPDTFVKHERSAIYLPVISQCVRRNIKTMKTFRCINRNNNRCSGKTVECSRNIIIINLGLEIYRSGYRSPVFITVWQSDRKTSGGGTSRNIPAFQYRCLRSGGINIIVRNM